ncbi:Putative homeodomain-like transcription factor superfamily protein [Zea mays]|uniref:Putative homeodomain-like transcription factor superfamily protein n=1 Tax=Zea mays TaxID=4577 RepID=A0A1D6MCR7_MAIZE|nr:Putative homeodomain-like transcription factor superfamily protein [Zea mays]
MKTPYQLEVLERTYAEDSYPNETKRAELSVQLNLTDRQLQMWFCHRRLKDRKPLAKRQLRDDEVSAPVIAPSPVLPPPSPPSEMIAGTVGTYREQLPPYSRRGPDRPSVPRLSVPEIGRRYYEPPQVMLPHMAPVHLTQAEHRVINSVEALIGEPLRDDGPVLGIEFDPLPPGAFGTPIVPEPPRQPFRSYDTKMFFGHDSKPMKALAFLPATDPLLPNRGKQKSLVGSSHLGSQAVHEYQFLPEQPSDTYERASQSHFYNAPAEASNLRVAPLSTGSRFLHGLEQAPSYTFHSQSSGSSHSAHRGRSPIALALTDHEGALSNINVSPTPIHGKFSIPQVAGFESSLASSERMGYHDDDTYRVDRKRKHNEEAKTVREVEAHEKRIRKELEKQDLLNRKREEQMQRETERLGRERRKEEERLMRERQREEEKFQREQRRAHKRMEKFMQKQSIRAEKLRQKEELRREKEAAKQKAANERATARRIARESMELMEDERLELLELASRSKGLLSMVSLDSDTLQQLDSFRGMLGKFPPETVRLKVPFSIKPWADSEDIIGNLLMVWKFFVTFGDVLGLPSFTLDEFVQALHDYDSRLLGELHIALLKSIIKDIEDVARTPSVALGVNQSSSANPGGGHPQIVEGAYAWGINILNWQHHLNFLTWPEILRQFGLCAGFGPQLKKSNAEIVHHRDNNEVHNGVDVISILRNGSAAVKAAALMKERGYTNRRSRHRLTPGTVKFAAFYVLSLEGSRGLTILEVAEKIQKSGLRDLTTSKTPEASVSAALSRDTKLFERTAPSTYCVKTPYRKDPDDSEAVLSAAREKIRVFQNTLSECEEVEKDVDEAERDEDSECDDATDDADGDDVNIEGKDAKSPLVGAQYDTQITVVGDVKKESNSVMNISVPPSIQIKSSASVPLHTLDSKASSSTDPQVGDDDKDTEIDESNQGESWVQGLAEGDYCDLSVDERLNAFVALIGVATEGNSIRAILETLQERLEAASALKKQMWAEAQLDKRRSRDDFTSKVQYDSCVGIKVDTDQKNNAAESTLVPVDNPIRNNNGNSSLTNNDLLVDKQNQLITGDVFQQWNGVSQELSTNPESLSVQQYASSEKTRSQLKSFIGHKAEQLYVYRSLPLGQDRRRNRYWQFSASSSSYDPGSGRVFFESRDGYWRVIDSSEAFEALVSSLDTRGIRESHLHSMLQSIEPTFREAVERKKCVSLEHTTGWTDNGSNESPNCNNEFGSPCSTLSGVASDNLMAYSDTFKIEIGHNEAEKSSISKRASVFLKWMWRECYCHQSTYTMKYGKKRCPELIQSCDHCYQIYLAEEQHCSSCHKSFKPIHNFLEHLSQCEDNQRTNPSWKTQIVGLSVPVGLRLLRLLLATIEASVPAEALLPFWTDLYRKSWGVKLYSASSAEEVLQMLSVLESAIKRDYLSSNFETTTELLNSNTQDATQNSVGGSGSATILPWVPDTTAAVALRLLDLDTSISYKLHSKLVSNKEQEAGDFMKLPLRYPSINKNKQEIEQFIPIGFDQQDGTLLTNSNGRRGGRGSRGGSRGGSSRGGGGRVPRGIGSSSRIQFRDDNSVPYGRAPRKNVRGGRTRGRGRGRGLRTVRPRQPSEFSATSIPKLNLLGSFSMLSKANHTGNMHSPESLGAEEWVLERREYVKDDDDNLVSRYDESEEENGEPMNEEYDEQISGYPRDNSEFSPIQMMGDVSHDEDAEGDEGEEDGEDYETEDPAGDEDDDVEMDWDDDIRDNDDGNGAANADEDEGGTSSYSSEYSE